MVHLRLHRNFVWVHKSHGAAHVIHTMVIAMETGRCVGRQHLLRLLHLHVHLRLALARNTVMVHLLPPWNYVWDPKNLGAVHAILTTVIATPIGPTAAQRHPLHHRPVHQLRDLQVFLRQEIQL